MPLKKKKKIHSIKGLAIGHKYVLNGTQSKKKIDLRCNILRIK